MNLVERVVMADSQRLDALLEQVVEWQSLGVTLDADGQMWPRVATATSTATTSTPRAGRKRARAPASPRQPGKRRAQSSMHHWQAEAVKLWETRAEAIATANAGSDKRMASWQKRKVELQSLREEARQLEEQLRTIRDGSAPSSAEGKHRRERQRQYVEIAWQLAAERAQEQKEAAIAENARLKSLVGKHLELSRALQPALFQDSSADLPRQARLQSTVERTALFASMEQKLTASLPNVKAVIQRTLGAASARARPVDGQHTRVVGVNTAHPVGSIQRSRAFPFRDDDVMDAMWNCAQRGFPDVAERTHWAEVLSADALGLDIIVDIPRQTLEGVRVSLHLRGVLKRWVTSAGSIVQFAGMTEWQTDSTTTAALTEEYSWSVTRGLGANSRSSHIQRSVESTLVSLGARPGGDTEPTSDHAACHEFMEKTVVPSIQHVTDRIDQATENALLDAARSD